MRDMKKQMALAALTAVCGFSAASMADVLYQQAPHTPGATGGNGLSTFQGGLPTPPPMFDREIADDFNVPGPGWNVNRVSASFIQNTVGDPNAVTGGDIRFFASSGGSVGALVATATVNTVTVTTGPGVYFGRPEQIVSFDLGSVNLPAGSYFVQIQPIVNHNWFWLTSSPTTPIAGSPAQVQVGSLNTPGNDATWPTTWQPTGPNNPIFTAASDQAFTIEGTVVPAPGAIALLALGGLCAGRRRR
jgi:MYXO-CTERM domain-containing protein